METNAEIYSQALGQDLGVPTLLFIPMLYKETHTELLSLCENGNMLIGSEFFGSHGAHCSAPLGVGYTLPCPVYQISVSEDKWSSVSI